MSKAEGSWSGMRRYLEKDMLADTLKGRVRYNCTTYVGMDGCHVFEVFFNGKLFKQFSWETVNSYFIKQGLAVKPPKMDIRDYWADYRTLLAQYPMAKRTEYTDGEFADALEKYRNQSIKDSLASDDPIVKMFALLDRRTGRRTMEKLAEASRDWPEWLRKAYEFRAQADGIDDIRSTIDDTEEKGGTTMEFKELIKVRRSIRKYASAPTHEELNAILKEAQQSPSWRNLQPARCYVVETPEKIKEFAAQALPGGNRTKAENAALIVTTFVRDLSGFHEGVAANTVGNGWGAYDLGLHDAYLILAASDAGYDTLIMGMRDGDAARKVLDIPDNETVMSVIAIGKRAEEAADRPRKALEETVKFF